MTLARLPLTVGVAVLVAGAAGCGSASKRSTGKPTSTTTTTAAATTTAPASSASGALTAEAQAAAAGDIPDNQVFLEFHSRAGYSVKYPEGWLQQGTGPTVTFQDKNNRIRVVLSKGPAFSAASVRADLASLKAANASFQATSPSTIAIPAKPAFKVSYTTESGPNPITNKRVTLAVDRYYLSRGGKRAILDLGAPKGVDNVDAFRLIAQSFRWR
jgi:hypothetical protein